VREQVEVAALLGDVAQAPSGERHYIWQRHGGHLGEGHVWRTLEVIITKGPAHLRKLKDAEKEAPQFKSDKTDHIAMHKGTALKRVRG